MTYLRGLLVSGSDQKCLTVVDLRNILAVDADGTGVLVGDLGLLVVTTVGILGAESFPLVDEGFPLGDGGFPSDDEGFPLGGLGFWGFSLGGLACVFWVVTSKTFTAKVRHCVTYDYV